MSHNSHWGKNKFLIIDFQRGVPGQRQHRPHVAHEPQSHMILSHINVLQRYDGDLEGVESDAGINVVAMLPADYPH